jgi:hypothetical protein
MSLQESVPRVASPKIDGSFPQLPEVIFQPRDFGSLCGLIWEKPDTAIAVIAGVSDRAAREYLNGNVAPPASVIAAINVAITFRTRR